MTLRNVLNGIRRTDDDLPVMVNGRPVTGILESEGVMSLSTTFPYQAWDVGAMRWEASHPNNDPGLPLAYNGNPVKAVEIGDNPAHIALWAPSDRT